MGSSPLTPRKDKRRAWLIAAAAGCVVILVVTVVATRGFGLADSTDHTSNAQTAQGRCEPEILNRLASPSTAKLSNVEAANTVLDPDSKDLFALLDDPLKGVDHSRITVWNVSGVVDAQNAFGAMIQDPFSCRAYFIDGNLANTLVLFDHDHWSLGTSPKERSIARIWRSEPQHCYVA